MANGRRVPRIDDPDLLRKVRERRRVGGVERQPDFGNVRSLMQGGVPTAQALGFDAPRILMEEGPSRLIPAPVGQRAPSTAVVTGAPARRFAEGPASTGPGPAFQEAARGAPPPIEASQLRQATEPPPIVEQIKERQGLLGKIAKVLEDPNVGAALSQFGMALTARDPNSFGFQLNAAHLQRHQARAASDLAAGLQTAQTPQERAALLRQPRPLDAEQVGGILEQDIRRRALEERAAVEAREAGVRERGVAVEEDLAKPQVGRIKAETEKVGAETAAIKEETDFQKRTAQIREQILRNEEKSAGVIEELRRAQASEAGARAGLLGEEERLAPAKVVIDAANAITREIAVRRQQLNDLLDYKAGLLEKTFDPKTGEYVDNPAAMEVRELEKGIRADMQKLHEALSEVGLAQFGGRLFRVEE